MPKRRATVGHISVPAAAWERIFGVKPTRLDDLEADRQAARDGYNPR